MGNIFRRGTPNPQPADPNQLWREEVRTHDRKVFLQATHWTFLLLFTVLFLGLLLLFHYVSPNSTITSASVTSWCLFVLISLLAWPVSLLMVFIGQKLFQMLSNMRKLEKFMYVIKHVSVPIAKFVWSLLMLVSWLCVFLVNPLPAYSASGEILSLDSGAYEYYSRALAAIIALNFIQLVKSILVELAAFKSRNETYFEQVRSAMKVGLILARLTYNMSGEGFNVATENNANASKTPAKTTQTDPNAFQPIFLADAQPIDGLKVDWKKFDLNALAVQELLVVCRNERTIRSQRDAEILGDVLFQHLNRSESEQEHLVQHDLYLTFPGESSRTFAETAFALLDNDNKKRLTKRDLQARCVELYHERKNLSSTLAGVDSIIRALRAFASGASYFLSFFVLLLIFSTSSIGDVVLSFTTIFLAISFAFGDAAKSFFNSFVFLFIRHPYDVGDRVFINGIDQPLYVHKLDLLTTTFQVWDGKLITIPNVKLHDATITNIHRSRNQTDVFTLDIDCRTPVKIIRQLELDWKAFLKSRPELFVAAKSDMFVRSIDDMSRLKIEYFAAYNTNWQYGEHMIRRHIVILKLKEICEQLGIDYSPPIQPIELVPSGDPGCDSAAKAVFAALGARAVDSTSDSFDANSGQASLSHLTPHIRHAPTSLDLSTKHHSNASVRSSNHVPTPPPVTPSKLRPSFDL